MTHKKVFNMSGIKQKTACYPTFNSQISNTEDYFLSYEFVNAFSLHLLSMPLGFISFYMKEHLTLEKFSYGQLYG